MKSDLDNLLVSQKIGLLTKTDPKVICVLPECNHRFHSSCLANSAWSQIVDSLKLVPQAHNQDQEVIVINDPEPPLQNLVQHEAWRQRERARLTETVRRHLEQLLAESRAVDPVPYVTKSDILRAELSCAICRAKFYVKEQPLNRISVIMHLKLELLILFLYIGLIGINTTTRNILQMHSPLTQPQAHHQLMPHLQSPRIRCWDGEFRCRCQRYYPPHYW